MTNYKEILRLTIWESTIFCSQFEVGGWYHKIGEPTLADAICDQIVHDSYLHNCH